jgi:hypothetical protein
LPLLTIGCADTSSIQVNVEGPPLGQCILHPPGSHAIVMGANVASMIVERLSPEDVKEGRRFRMTGLLTPSAPPAPPLPDQPRSVKVDGQVSIFVALQNVPPPLVPVERTVEQVVTCVADIVTRFEAHF